MTELIIIIVLGLAMISVIVLMIPSKVIITSESIKLGKFLYVEIFFNNIENVRLYSQYPRTIRRIHGFDSGDIKKGIFETADGRKIRLHLYQGYPPYVEIISRDGLFVFNTTNSDKTEELYHELKSKLSS